jgi:hypothetical protein
MKHLAFAGCAGIALSGCSMASLQSLIQPPDEIIYVMVKTRPDGAMLSFPDGTICESPCRVGVTEPLDMQIARIGYEPREIILTRQTPSPLIVEMTPVMQDGDIEEVALPDL